MKQLASVLLFFQVTFTFAQTSHQAQTGWYFLAEKPIDGMLVHVIGSEDLYAIEKMPLLSKPDFKNVRIVTRDFEPDDLKAIEIKLTKDARKKWNDAKKRISKTKESIVFVYNDTVYMTKFGDNKTLGACIDLVVDQKFIDEIFQALKS